MSNTLATTRRQLRNILVPGSQDDNDPQDAGHFPRSKVMRFAFNPRNRRILLLSGSIPGVVASRMVGTGGMNRVAGIARSLFNGNRNK